MLKFFIETRLKTDGGFLTNYLPDAERKDVATGHELLSESSGLYLRNLAFDTQGRFDNFTSRRKTPFTTASNLVIELTSKAINTMSMPRLMIYGSFVH